MDRMRKSIKQMECIWGGEHKVELNYVTPGLKMGTAVSLVGWAALAILALLRRRYVIK